MAINYVYIALCFLFHLATCREDSGQTSTSVCIKVDRSGTGDYLKIREAIDAVPSNNSENVLILINPGVYKEKIVVPVDKPFITMSGPKHGGKVVITWNESGGIFESPTFSVLASDFTANHLTIKNTYGSGAKAVALRVSGDRAAFFGCRILSHQDTLLDDKGRHYYNKCYIQGDTDFICGNGASLFEKCHLHSVSEANGAITAQHRGSPNEKTGFTFVNCKISGLKSALLGRPWGAYSRVIFARTYMSNVVLPQGWDNWGDISKQRTSYFGEYKCYGPGSSTSRRVNWSHSLTNHEAKSYLMESINGGKSWVRMTPIHFLRALNDSFGQVGGKQP